MVVLDLEDQVDAVLGQDEPVHPAHRHTAVGHLAAGEGTAGVAEVGGDLVGPVDDVAVELGVPRAHEGDAEQRDDHEDHQLDLGTTS